MKKVLIIASCILFIVSCQMLPLKKNDYYTRTQMLMIEKTTEAVQVGFGFDSRLDMNYFFFKKEMSKEEASQSFGGLNSKSEEEDAAAENVGAVIDSYAKVIASYPDTEQYEFYTKVYRLYSMIDYLHGYYKRFKIWREYNMLRLDLYPATRYYMDITEAYFKTKKPALYRRITKQKKEIRQEAIMFVQKKYTIVDEY